MSNDTHDERASRGDVPRRLTTEGRTFGNISYAAEEPERSDDLRRRTTGSGMEIISAPRISTGQRDTGARKRASGR